MHKAGVNKVIDMSLPKPITRSRLRLALGRLYFFCKKQLGWHLSGTRFALTKSDQNLPFVAFGHQSLLRRPLKDVELWMQENKITNLKLAIKQLDDLILYPGEVLSYWRLLGRPTKRRGYVPGMMLKNGTVEPGIGGGLCQLSNLVYWMTLHTPLTVIERWRHSYDVFPDANRTQPFGSGATCAYPNIDLQIKNETEQPFQLHLELTDTHLVGTWLTTKPLRQHFSIEERHHRIEQQWWGGYTRHNELWKITTSLDGQSKIDEQQIAENQAIMMYAPLINQAN